MNNRKDNYKNIQEIKNLLKISKRPIVENFMMGEEEAPVDYDEEEVVHREKRDEGIEFNEIREAIVQIRKISINIIAKLADNPTSESYTFMKRVLDMSDKAMESMNNNNAEKE